MRKLIIWLAKVFKVDITTEKVVIKEVIKEVTKEVEKLVALSGVIEGDVTVKGDLTVEGGIYVKGNIIAFEDIQSNVGMNAKGEITAYKIKGGK